MASGGGSLRGYGPCVGARYMLHASRRLSALRSPDPLLAARGDMRKVPAQCATWRFVWLARREPPSIGTGTPPSDLVVVAHTVAASSGRVGHFVGGPQRASYAGAT